MHAADALGNPVRLPLGPGRRREVTRSHELANGLNPDAVIAGLQAVPRPVPPGDRFATAFGAGHLRGATRDKGDKAVPPRSNRRPPHGCDKLLPNRRGFVLLAATGILLR